VPRLVLCLSGVVFCASLSFAQSSTSGAIGGVVTDMSDAVVPDARLTITETNNRLTRTAQTDNRGEYKFLLVPPGTYDLTVEKEGFTTGGRKGLVLTVGETATQDFHLALTTNVQSVDIQADAPLIEPERTQQSDTIVQNAVKNLPINRRDYLDFTLLAPGVTDSKALADGQNYRVKQTQDSGLSFYGSNGRGNNISVDGGEANDSAGGVRPTVSQETVQEFQINRTNYSAEYGSARGGVINIITKGGSNQLHGSLFGFFRDAPFDATNPFSVELQGNVLKRIKPDSSRQQFGGTFGGPIKHDKTFYFLGYEQLRRREFATVPVLTDPSIFGPTPQQNQLLATAPAVTQAVLTLALTSPPSTIQMFKNNSGIFPFQTDTNQGFMRLDHQFSPTDQATLRYNVTREYDTNVNVNALVGFSRGYIQDKFDSTGLARWTHLFSPTTINDAHVQFNYGSGTTATNDPYGPSLDIQGYGFFNRDIFLPDDELYRRVELADTLNLIRGKHTFKLGLYSLIRQNTSHSDTFLGGRFIFGDLPGYAVNPVLAPTTITALQAFNLGLAEAYQQGFGDPTVRAVYPLGAAFVQDSWAVSPRLTLNLGMRWEVDSRKPPLPTNYANFGPRVGFAWDPFGDHKTIVRGGYGVFWATIDFQIDYVVNALNQINGKRQIAQVLTTLDPNNPFAVNGPINVFQTLRAQGIVGVPTPTRTIQASDLAQFGIFPSQTGPLPPFSVLFHNSPDYQDPEAEQSSLEIERQIGRSVSLSASYVFVRGLHLTTSRDDNVLPAPINPATGIPDWGPTADNPSGTKYFVNPLIYQDNVYESTANSFYSGMTLTANKRFSQDVSAAFNYTFSKATDETTDYNSDFQPNIQTCRRCERALSSFDQRHKVVLYGVFTPRAAGPGTGWRRLLSGFTFSPIFVYDSPRPFNLLAGSDLNNDRHNTTDRPYFAGRNTGIGPRYINIDARLSHLFRLREHLGAELMAEAFNLTNTLNYTSVNNTVGNMPPPFNVHGNPNLTPSQPLGFTGAAPPRQIQLGFRVLF